MSRPVRQLPAWRNRIFSGAWMLYVGYYICRKDLDPTAGAGISHFAIALACFGIAYALSQFVGGELADRFGGRNTALAGAAISILCTIGMAWASPRLNLFLQFGNGFGQGFGWPALLKLIGVWFRRDERDQVMGWWSTSYILGGFLATSLAALLMSSADIGAGSAFHPAYLVPSAILLCTTLFFAWETRGLPLRTSENTITAELGSRKTHTGVWRTILADRTLRIISAMYFFLKMTRYTLLFWLPHYLVSSRGYSTYTAVHTASCFEIAGILGPITVGYAVERWFDRQRMGLGAGMLYALAFICLLHPLLAAGGWFGMILSISMMGILIHGADLLMSGMTVLHAVPDELQGHSVGFVNGIGSIGQTISPLLATLFVAHFGWARLFDLFVFFALVSGVICTFGARPQPMSASRSNPSMLEPSNLPL
jgi:sugar phosphate permease